MAMRVLILNGPNLNLLGSREPEIYGAETLADIEARCRALAGDLGQTLGFRQSNAEHALIDWIQEARGAEEAIIINPAGFTHSSVAILDALMAFEGLVVEVHLSNVHKREAFRRHSYVSQRADGVIAGLGAEGYLAALRFVAAKLGGR